MASFHKVIFPFPYDGMQSNVKDTHSHLAKAMSQLAGKPREEGMTATVKMELLRVIGGKKSCGCFRRDGHRPSECGHHESGDRSASTEIKGKGTSDCSRRWRHGAGTRAMLREGFGAGTGAAILRGSLA